MRGGAGLVLPVVRGLFGGVHNRHGAVRPVHDTLADRAEEEALEPATAASAHDDETGVLTLTYQRLHRESANAVSTHDDVRVLLLTPGQRL